MSNYLEQHGLPGGGLYSLPSATREDLPIAIKMAERIICLPMHHALTDEDDERVLICIKATNGMCYTNLFIGVIILM